MMLLMGNIEPLHIPQSKKWKGLTVFCNKCKTSVYDICKESGKPIKKCKYGDRHGFKVTAHVPGTENARKTLMLDTRDVDEAIKEAIDFLKSVKENCKAGNIQTKPSERIEIKSGNEPNILIHLLAKYLAWLNNEGLPKSLIIERDKDYIKDIERAYMFLVECLSKEGYDMNTFSVHDIDYIIVGKVVDALNNKEYANRTINKILTYYSSALKWHSEYSGQPIRNFFKHRRFETNYNPKQFPMKEFEALLKQITPENGIGYDNGIKPRRNYYYSWLPFAYRLALETGRRREELTTMKWNDIKEINGELCILVLDIKVNRIKKRLTENQKRYNPTPVTPELMQLLSEMGYEKYKGTDNYILAPEVNISRGKVMCNILSRSFAHYYKQLNTGNKLTFKSLRKANFTQLQLKYGDNARFISGHTSTNILGTRYVDHNAVAVRALDIIKNEKEAARQKELEKLRIESNNNEQQKDLNL